jgi:predicted GNAT superfamily acetyltransferase
MPAGRRWCDNRRVASLVAPGAHRLSAATVAEKAAERAGVAVTLLDDVDSARCAADLFARTWRVTPPALPVSAELLRALAHAGNYVSGAWAGGELVGASAAFFGRDNHGVFLHSHITGVAPESQGASTGFALKQHQRAWALAKGIEVIKWTFDPLVRRNAWFNLVKLAAVADSYEEDFYGSMQDEINFGDASDRCGVSWHLNAEPVVRAAQGLPAVPGPALLADGGTRVILDEDAQGRPVLDTQWPRLSLQRTQRLLCRVPADITGIRMSDGSLAQEWRLALRHTMGAAMATQFVATTITPDGWYVLTRPDDGGGA